jgi:hypothetical protein
MPSLLARFQEIIGEKLFRDKVTFAKDVVFKRAITAYSPVASEPSLGTLHPHYKELVTNGAYAVAGYTTIDPSAEVSAGATMVYIWIQHKAAGANVDVAVYTDSTPTPAGSFMISRNPVAGGYGMATGIVRLSSIRKFVINNSAAVTEVFIRMFFYGC